jgi:hypothetical protein
MPKGPIWSETEENLLKKRIAEGKEPDEICLEFHKLQKFSLEIHPRSSAAIRRHITAMEQKEGKVKAPNSKKRWLSKDDQLLLELYRDTTLEPEEIGAHLGRSGSAVKSRIATIGIAHLRNPPEGFFPRILKALFGSGKRVKS